MAVGCSADLSGSDMSTSSATCSREGVSNDWSTVDAGALVSVGDLLIAWWAGFKILRTFSLNSFATRFSVSEDCPCVSALSLSRVVLLDVLDTPLLVDCIELKSISVFVSGLIIFIAALLLFG